MGGVHVRGGSMSTDEPTIQIHLGQSRSIRLTVCVRRGELRHEPQTTSGASRRLHALLARAR